MKTPNSYREYVLKEMIEGTTLEIMSDDHEDGVYIKFPFLRGGYVNKKSFLYSSDSYKHHTKEYMTEQYGVPSDMVEDLYNDYYADVLRLLYRNKWKIIKNT
jgi:hypothetical protein